MEETQERKAYGEAMVYRWFGYYFLASFMYYLFESILRPYLGPNWFVNSFLIALAFGVIDDQVRRVRKTRD
jgi:hypothetical protein